MTVNDWLHGEPPIEELLEDPITHMVMRRDGLSAEEVRDAIALSGVASSDGTEARDPAAQRDESD